MGPVAAGEIEDPLYAFRSSFGHHLGRAELLPEVSAVLVPAHQDDLLGAEPLGRQHRRQADRTIPDHRHRGSWIDAGGHRAVVSGREHV